MGKQYIGLPLDCVHSNSVRALQVRRDIAKELFEACAQGHLNHLCKGNLEKQHGYERHEVYEAFISDS